MSTVPRYNVYLRNSSFTMYERLDVWSSLKLVMRFNKTGTWNLEVPTNTVAAGRISPSTGIIVQRDGHTIFSGPSGGTEESYVETKNVLKISGTDDNVFLETPARPTPSLSSPPYPDEYDVTTGVASNIMQSLVNRNIGPGAPPEWRITGLTLGSDPGLGSTITARARFDPLMILLAELGSSPMAGGLGFKILQSDNLTASLVFQIYSPTDRHLTTQFSTDLRTAIDYEWKHLTPDANYFIVAGGDDFGNNRTILEDGDADSIAAVGRRIAVFVDKRGVTDVGELNQTLAELMAGVITTDVVTITPTETPALVYGTDFDLGDYVTAIVKGQSFDRLIREIEIDFNPTRGPIITPTIADPNGTNDEILSRHLATMEGRISNIERNWNVPNDSLIEDMFHPTMKWYPGDMKMTARSAAQQGWMLCDGAAINRSTYGRLFSAIGTIFGAGNGSTTFNIPDTRDVFPVGKGSTHSLGSRGGVDGITVTVPNHQHGLSNHSHTGAAHTHPGSHSHDAGSLAISHDHQVNIDHDHPAKASTVENYDGTSAFGHTPSGATGFGHRHDVDLVALGTLNKNTGTPNNVSRSGSTGSDTNAPVAIYGATSGVPAPNISDLGGTSSTTSNFEPKFVTVNHQIYTGA